MDMEIPYTVDEIVALIADSINGLAMRNCVNYCDCSFFGLFITKCNFCACTSVCMAWNI